MSWRFLPARVPRCGSRLGVEAGRRLLWAREDIGWLTLTGIRMTFRKDIVNPEAIEKRESKKIKIVWLVTVPFK